MTQDILNRGLNDRFFFASTGMEPDRLVRLVRNGLRRADGGELFMQRQVGSVYRWTGGRLASNSTQIDQGFGLRQIAGNSVAYAHSNDLSERAIRRAINATGGIRHHVDCQGKIPLSGRRTLPGLYENNNPLDDLPGAERIRLLEEIDAYTRAADPRVIEVSAVIQNIQDIVTIIRHDGERFDDVRPLSLMSISLVIEENGRRENGRAALSARKSLTTLFSEHAWKDIADDAVRQATTNLRAIPAPSGEMPVIIGNGWGGVLLHEAVGHGLEGDAALRGRTVFRRDLLGQRVASKGVTIVDQGNIAGSRGALTFDDEGTPTGRAVLIEDGILVGYMTDLVHARAMGVSPTGNGRRQDYAHLPLPRMTTTYMQAGEHSLEEMIESVDRGVYAVDFSGGQVNTSSGSYVFSSTEAYLIEKGRITSPLCGAILQGNGPKSMQMVDMIGTDFKLTSAGGSCGKQGQSIAVGLGQPSVKMRGITVGGTAPS